MIACSRILMAAAFLNTAEQKQAAEKIRIPFAGLA
jgi:hypothetical protein